MIYRIFMIILFISCNRWEGNALQKSLPFLNINSSPRILFISPGNNSRLATGKMQIEVIFSKSMNFTSCQNAFSIVPNVTGYFESSGFTMKFIPRQELEVGLYTYTITKNCEDLEGNDIENISNAQFFVGDSGQISDLKLISLQWEVGNQCSLSNFSSENTLEISPEPFWFPLLLL